MQIEAACAGGRGHPHVFALDGNAVHHVVAQAGVQLSEGVDASARDAAEPAHGAGPHIASALVQRQ